MPTLAVVIPVYNRPDLVLETLASVRAQTVAADRIVVVDDGSTDATMASIESWVERHPFSGVFTLLHQANGGVSRARNAGAALVDTDLVTFLDSDDLWPPDLVARAKAGFAAHPEWVAASVPFRIDRTLADGTLRVDKAGALPTSGHGPAMLARCYPGTPSTIFARSAFAATPGFCPNLRFSEDLLLFLQISVMGPWGRLPGLPAVYRYGPQAGSTANCTDRLRFARQLERVLNPVQRSCRPWHKGMRGTVAKAWLKLGIAYAKQRQPARARAALRRAARWQPWNLKVRWQQLRIRISTRAGHRTPITIPPCPPTSNNSCA